MSFKVVTFNCRGLGGLDKRRDVLNYIKQKQFSISFLQDTHFTLNDYEQDPFGAMTSIYLLDNLILEALQFCLTILLSIMY